MTTLVALRRTLTPCLLLVSQTAFAQPAGESPPATPEPESTSPGSGPTPAAPASAANAPDQAGAAAMATSKPSATRPADEFPPQEPSSKPVRGGVQAFLGVPVGFLGNRLRREQGLTASGWGIDLGAGIQYWWFNLLIDLGFEHYGDSKEFAQTVVDQYGNVSRATSRVNLSYFAPAVGLKTPVFVVVPRIFAFTLGTNFGYAFPFDTSRQIVDCTDCKKESISVKGGAYVEPAVELLWPSAPRAQYGLGVSWQKFLGDSDYTQKLVFRAVVMGQF